MRLSSIVVDDSANPLLKLRATAHLRLRFFPPAAHCYGMKASLSFFLTSALIIGATSLAFGAPRDGENSDNKAKHASSSHKSRSSTHHHSTGSHKSSNSGSKEHSNVPSN